MAANSKNGLPESQPTPITPSNVWAGMAGKRTQHGNTDGNTQPRTLYVGNLDSQITEEFLTEIFSHLGSVRSCKLFKEGNGNGDAYAFIEYVEHGAAVSAFEVMDKRTCLGKEIKVGWAMPSMDKKSELVQGFFVFVGDLSTEVDAETLRGPFSQFGKVTECRVVRDQRTLMSKGYGFVTFRTLVEAESAIRGMNGVLVGSRRIKTNWATRQNPLSTSDTDKNYSTDSTLSYEDVFKQSSPSNCTVYCSRITNGLTDALMQETFSQFGKIEHIRRFPGKGYAFVRFSTKKSAANAIVHVHNTKINGNTVKCSWGKEQNATNEQASYSNFYNANSYPATYVPVPEVQQQPSYWGYPHGDYASSVLDTQFQSQFYEPHYPQFGYYPQQYLPNPTTSQGIQYWNWNNGLANTYAAPAPSGYNGTQFPMNGGQAGARFNWRRQENE